MDAPPHVNRTYRVAYGRPSNLTLLPCASGTATHSCAATAKDVEVGDGLAAHFA